MDYPNAINDLSQALLLATPAQKNEVYVLRGQYYHEFGQEQAAINDFTQVILVENNNFEALYSRAGAYEASLKYEEAISDYEALLKMSPYDDHARELLSAASLRLYELNKETNTPKLVFIEPDNVDQNKVPIPKNLLEALVHIQVEDASKIAMIQVNGENIAYDKEVMNPEFKFRVYPKEQSSFEVVVEDVYANRAVLDYKIVATEIDSPLIRIFAPYASDDGEIYLDNNEPTLYIEGKIEDDSRIISILIDGATASYIVDDINPNFSATLNIANKAGITIKAVDSYGNVTTQKFRFNREGAIIAASNPMGKTILYRIIIEIIRLRN